MTSLFVRSALLADVPHGFSLRGGGVSEGAFASLNCGDSVGDAPDHVAENMRRLATAAERDGARLSLVRQVHGDGVVRARPGSTPAADALWTDAPGEWVAIRTADCVPVLLADPEGERVAAVHAGWRGTAARVVARAVEALARAGTPPDRLRAAVGPAIQACCYRVGEDLAVAFERLFGADVVRATAEGPHLDLARAVRRTLCEAGVPEDQVDVRTDCTACDAERFYSHRRDRGHTGRHLNFVAVRALS